MDGESDEPTDGEDKASQRWRDQDKVDGDKWGVDSRDKVRHIERNDQLGYT